MPYVTVARDNTTDVGRSQPWDGYDYDTFIADLHALIEHLAFLRG
jgi:hypothetical protein